MRLPPGHVPLGADHGANPEYTGVSVRSLWPSNALGFPVSWRGLLVRGTRGLPRGYFILDFTGFLS